MLHCVADAAEVVGMLIRGDFNVTNDCGHVLHGAVKLCRWHWNTINYKTV